MRCKFEIISRDGNAIAFCASCNHGYLTEMLDATLHVRECRPGRGVAGGPAVMGKRVMPESACALRGLAATRLVSCAGCRGNVQIKVFPCPVHGECTIDQKVDGVRMTCTRCPDRKPSQDTPPARDSS